MKRIWIGVAVGLLLVLGYGVVRHGEPEKDKPDPKEARVVVADSKRADTIQILAFARWVRDGEKEKVAQSVGRWPLRRQYPLPSIQNAEEFVERFDEVFDADFRRRVGQAGFGGPGWAPVGWRGVMVENGQLWLTAVDGIGQPLPITDTELANLAISEDEIRSVVPRNLGLVLNYESPAETTRRKAMLAKLKAKLHPDVREFQTPVLEWRTKKFHVRVDQLADRTYRYASWSTGRKMSEKPDIVLHGGELRPDGTGGNHKWWFRNGAYLYELDNYSRICTGEEDGLDRCLRVYKEATPDQIEADQTKLILTQPVTVVIHD